MIIWVNTVAGLMGYDCGTYNGNHSRVNLKDMEKCVIPKPIAVEKTVQLQLLQVVEYTTVYVQECMIEIKRIINYCGYISGYLVAGGLAEYYWEPTREDCKGLHERGRIHIRKQEMTSLKRNSTEARTVTLAGSLKTNGECKGEDYSDGFGLWDNVVVTASVKITLRDYYAQVNMEEDIIFTNTGAVAVQQSESIVHR